MHLRALRDIVVRLLAALLLMPLAPAGAQTLVPDFTSTGLGTAVVVNPQPDMSYTTQGGVLSLRYVGSSGSVALAGGSAQWVQPLDGDFIFRATVDITGLNASDAAFMNAGVWLSFTSGAYVALAPWRDGAGASVVGGYATPILVAGSTYVFSPFPAMDIVMERRGTTITQWAGAAGSGALQPLLTITSADFSGPALSNFYLHIRQPGPQIQAAAAFSNVSVSPVPEPATLLMLTAGLLVLARWRSPKRR